MPPTPHDRAEDLAGRARVGRRRPAPASASSACTRTTRTGSPAATIRWARGWPSASSPCTPSSGPAGSPRSIRARTRSGCSWSSRGAGRSTDPPTELARDMAITRLGAGVDRTGRFDADALAPHRRGRSGGSAGGPGRSAPSASGSARRARCATPRTATSTRPRCSRARRVRARGHHRRAGSRPLVPRGHRTGSTPRRGRSPCRTSAADRPSS